MASLKYNSVAVVEHFSDSLYKGHAYYSVTDTEGKAFNRPIDMLIIFLGLIPAGILVHTCNCVRYFAICVHPPLDVVRVHS